MKIRKELVIDSSEWDKTVKEIYKRPYCFQQQDGCQPRGIRRIEVPSEHIDIFGNVEESLDAEMGVSFENWLERDPKEKISEDSWVTGLWWERNFYPDIQMVANDLHKRGILPKGSYAIEIDW